jgi:nitroreductase
MEGTTTRSPEIPPAAAVPDLPTMRAIGDRRTTRFYDPDRAVEPWKVQAILQAGRLASCQGNINATEAIVARRGACELWDQLEECVSGFNVQIVDQCSHLVIWLTNLDAWYGRANDSLSTLSLSAGVARYHGWSYDFLMRQTLPRLMSFPRERTDLLLRFETGLAVGQALLAAVSLGVGTGLVAFGRKPGGVERAFALPDHYRFTWAQALGYPLEEPHAGGQRPRLRFERLFHDGRFGVPLRADPAADDLLREKGMLQEQAPLPGRFEEIDRIAARFGREPGCVHWPAAEIRRLLDDPAWEFGEGFRAHAEAVLAAGDLPDYPEEMRELLARLATERGTSAPRT